MNTRGIELLNGLGNNLLDMDQKFGQGSNNPVNLKKKKLNFKLPDSKYALYKALYKAQYNW